MGLIASKVVDGTKVEYNRFTNTTKYTSLDGSTITFQHSELFDGPRREWVLKFYEKDS